MKILGILGVCAGLVLAATGCGAGSAHQASSRVQGQDVKLTASRGSIPAWAEKCLPTGSQRLGTAPKYVGLTRAAALRLSNSPALVFAGGGGRCSTFRDDVYRRRPIAVVYNVWNVRRPDAKIVAAVRATPGWHPGG